MTTIKSIIMTKKIISIIKTLITIIITKNRMIIINNFMTAGFKRIEDCWNKTIMPGSKSVSFKTHNLYKLSQIKPLTTSQMKIFSCSIILQIGIVNKSTRTSDNKSNKLLKGKKHKKNLKCFQMIKTSHLISTNNKKFRNSKNKLIKSRLTLNKLQLQKQTQHKMLQQPLDQPIIPWVLVPISQKLSCQSRNNKAKPRQLYKKNKMISILMKWNELIERQICL